jgi:hypothetical protein
MVGKSENSMLANKNSRKVGELFHDKQITEFLGMRQTELAAHEIYERTTELFRSVELRKLYQAHILKNYYAIYSESKSACNYNSWVQKAMAAPPLCIYNWSLLGKFSPELARFKLFKPLWKPLKQRRERRKDIMNYKERKHVNLILKREEPSRRS